MSVKVSARLVAVLRDFVQVADVPNQFFLSSNRSGRQIRLFLHCFVRSQHNHRRLKACHVCPLALLTSSIELTLNPLGEFSGRNPLGSSGVASFVSRLLLKRNPLARLAAVGEFHLVGNFVGLARTRRVSLPR